MKFVVLWRLLLALVVGFLVFDQICPAGWHTFVTRNLVAERIAIVDQYGQVRMTLGTATGSGEPNRGGGINPHDPGVSVSVSGDGGQPYFYMNGNDESSISLELLHDKPELSFETYPKRGIANRQRLELTTEELWLASYNSEKSAFETTWTTATEEH